MKDVLQATSAKCGACFGAIIQDQTSLVIVVCKLSWHVLRGTFPGCLHNGEDEESGHEGNFIGGFTSCYLPNECNQVFAFGAIHDFHAKRYIVSLRIDIPPQVKSLEGFMHALMVTI